MTTVRIALANVRVPDTPDESVRLAVETIAEAGRRGALVVCFPGCFVPGYRWPGTTPRRRIPRSWSARSRRSGRPRARPAPR